MARRSTIEDPMPPGEVRQRGVGFWLFLLAVAVIAMGLFSCVGTESLRMQETESGLRYQALRSGDGDQPGPEDEVLVHYESRLEDGTVFGSTYVRGGPTRFTVNEAIPGWAEGLQLMRPGGRYRFEIPPELAFGDEGEGDAVPPGSTVVYEVELLDVIAKPDPVSADYTLSETESGLQYEMLREGEGTPPGPNDMVLVHYRGQLQDGTVFDSSYDRGQPAGFGVGQVIPGWTEGLQMMKPGSKWAFVIPPELAYGERGVGPIPPNSELVFEVELLDIQRADDAAGTDGE